VSEFPNYNLDMSSINELTTEVRAFAEARDWGQFHTLRNLALALAGEVGELAAELQWVSDSKVDAHLAVPANREAFESEIADVATYLLRICDVAGVDLESAVRNKLQVNESRYPIDTSKGSAAKYDKLETR